MWCVIVVVVVDIEVGIRIVIGVEVGASGEGGEEFFDGVRVGFRFGEDREGGFVVVAVRIAVLRDDGYGYGAFRVVVVELWAGACEELEEERRGGGGGLDGVEGDRRVGD